VNPRALAAWSLAGLVVALGTTNPYYRGLVALAGIALLLSRARPEARLRPLLLLLLSAAAGAALLNPLLSHLGDDVLFSLPGWIPVAGGPITTEAAAFGLVAGLGIVASALAVAPLSLAIESHELINALPHFLDRTGTAVSASLHLVPGIARSYTAIREGQLLRGWRPGGPAAWGEVLVPTLLTAIEDSVQLAEAMEARAYGSGPRTSFTVSRWRSSDTVLLLASATVAGGFLLARAFGAGADWHAYPRLTAPELQPFLVALCLLLFVPALPWPHRR
jgi:energy-coupling factor transport system permease protein